MKKKLLALVTLVALCIMMMSMTVSAATPSMTGSISNGTLTISFTGLGSDIAQVNVFAVNKSDATDYILGTAVITSGAGTVSFSVAGKDYTVQATPKNSSGVDQTSLSAIEVTSYLGVSYSAHVQKKGWMTPVSDGTEAGTDGLGLRVEALKINLAGSAPTGAAITYKAYVQRYGWQNAVSNGIQAGTDGKALRIEALKVTLSGLTGYAVSYRVHVQNVGWMDWQTTKNGTAIDSATIAGTMGKSLRIEAIEIKIQPIS